MANKFTNLVKRFAGYLLGDRKRAIIIAVIFAIMPFLTWISVVVLCLVTLRKGPREGLYVLLGPLAISLFVGMSRGLAEFNLIISLIGFVVPWILSIVLRNTISWERVLEVGTLLTIGSVLIFHVLVPDTQQYWLNAFNQIGSDQGVMGNFFQAFQNGEQANTMQDIEITAQYATRILVLLMFLAIMLNLLIARWMQALLYNPSGLVKELRMIRVHWVHVLVTAIVLLGAKMGNMIAYDSFLIAIVPFVISGISLVHFIANTTSYTGYMLFAFYCLLLLFIPYVVGLLTIVVLADIGLDLRRRLIKQV